jgi:predicted alpha-1,2-mannosidase
MKKILLLAICELVILYASAQKDFTSLVNPFIGTGGHGHTYPGASMPFGMMQLSPDTRMADWDGSSGYHYSDSVIYGFSHTHLSGTGIPDYCDVLMMPFSGQVKWAGKEYRSAFSHKNEKASPGYYEVQLDKHNIKAQLTTSYRSGMHQYTFSNQTNDGAILIDLEHRDQVLESYLEKVSAYELRGLRRSKSWAKDQYVYFTIQFEQPIIEFALLTDEGMVVNTSIGQGLKTKAFVRFNTATQKVIRAKVGISAVSTDGAKLNLTTEIPDWDFEKIKVAAVNAWNKELGKIVIKGGTKDQQVNFYTALYHTFLAPNIFQDVDGKFRSTDNKIHKAKGFTNYSVFSLWDTYRAYHPLMTIINQQRTTDWINTFLTQYRNGGMLPVWELAGNETFCMIGYHSVPVIVDAWQKGIRGFDEKLALEAMRSYAESDRFGLSHYRENGFLSNEKEHESVSKTLEYAYDDWCISQYAGWLGYDSIASSFEQRSQYWKNLFDPYTKHMRGKVHGMWYTTFDAKEINNFYTEGNSWHYSFAVPQDINGLIRYHGGKENFVAKLNELFTTTSKTTGRDQADVTGLIGQYAHGNEPSHHMAYLFNYAGMPWRTQELVNRINTTFYKNAPDGLIGNEDCGQMSAWHVLSAMGFYPVCPGDGRYIFGTPLFEEVKIHLENGKTFTIQANRKDPKTIFINNVKLNGSQHPFAYLDHEAIMQGGNLEFGLQSKPNYKWGTASDYIPRSKSPAKEIVAVPYVMAPSNKFRENVEVKLASPERDAQLFYRWIQPNIRSVFVPYERPITLSASGELEIYAQKGADKSAVINQPFFKYPDDRSIQVQSKVHPMYMAGGQDALIDGVMGTTNWRTGEWQSYFDTDLDAVIDLKRSKNITFLGVHVLQDVSPWILYPKEVIFYSSQDGKSFHEVKRISNTVDQRMETVQTQELGTALQFTARYIKVKVINGGKLPSWHESAGNPSHLFIDEIIIR